MHATAGMARSALLTWLLVRTLLVVVALYVLRHPILNFIETHFDIVWITSFVIEQAALPVSRILIAVVLAAGFFGLAKLAARGRSNSWAISIALVGVVSAAIALWAGDLKPALAATLLVAIQWTPISAFRRMGIGHDGVGLLVALPPGVSEGLLTSRYVKYVRDVATGRTPHFAETPAHLPGALLAALAMAVLIPGERIAGAEAAMRRGEDVRMFYQGDVNGLAYDPGLRRLYATGHGTEHVLAFDVASLDAAPVPSEGDTGRSQAISLDPVRHEIYTYASGADHIVVTDARDMSVKKRIAVPEVPQGDSWIEQEPVSGAIFISSEADLAGGKPILVVDRETGEVIDQRDEEAGNILVHPGKPIVYMSFFRRFVGVLAYDVEKREIVASAPADNGRMDRMAFDSARNELLLTAPAESLIVRHDADTLERKGDFKSIFGVRVIAIDEERDAMIVASLASGEVARMRLSDHAIDKTWYVAPWLRSVVLAQDSGKAYVSSKGGLYELDYASDR